MESKKSLRELLNKLFEGDINEAEYKVLQSYLIGMMKGVSSKMAVSFQRTANLETAPKDIISSIGRLLSLSRGDTLEHLLLELITYILRKRHNLEPILVDENSNLNAYLAKLIANFLIDTFKSLKTGVEIITESDINRDEDEGKGLLEDVKDEDVIKHYELIELKALFHKSVDSQEIKYICYKLDSKSYKCLWGNKSDDAIYQDVRRRGKKVIEKLAVALREAGVEEETFQLFIKKYLSGLCEELRLKECNGEEK